MAEAWREALSDAEVRELLEMRDWRSWLSIAVDWGTIGAALALVARWPNPLTVVVALFVIGGRQLGLAVLMHEAAHRTLFRERRLNDLVGNWLCAYPVWSDLYPYRPYHLQHHAKTWTENDPDLPLAAPFPVTRASMRRKIWRDLSGRTGWKRLKATLRRDLGLSRGRVKRNFDAGLDALGGVAVTNGVLLGVLALAGRNTRTTLARWWERLLLAPNRVNYHLEHHLVMTVPHYNLPRMHRLLRARGVLEDACVTRGYLDVLRLASARAAA